MRGASAVGAASSDASIQAASTIQAKTNKTSRLLGYDCRLQEKLLAIYYCQLKIRLQQLILLTSIATRNE
ncbi:unnamed protein product [Urochloa humidicola]